MRRFAPIALVLAVIATPSWLLSERPWDARVSSEKAAQFLQAALANRVPYTCSRVEQDGTVGDGEMDVDYFCEPARENHKLTETGYWFGTDSTQISTELISAG